MYELIDDATYQHLSLYGTANLHSALQAVVEKLNTGLKYRVQVKTEYTEHTWLDDKWEKLLSEFGIPHVSENSMYVPRYIKLSTLDRIDMWVLRAAIAERVIINVQTWNGQELISYRSQEIVGIIDNEKQIFCVKNTIEHN